MWECLVKHAEVIRDLTLSTSAVIAVGMGGWRLWLADKKDCREEKCREREEKEYWQKRFAEAVRQVLDETDKGTLSEARRIHALHDMAWVAENDRTGMFMSQAKDVVERFKTIAVAQWELVIDYRMSQGRKDLPDVEEIREKIRRGEIPRPEEYTEDLLEMTKTGAALYDLHKAAAHYREKWEGKPPNCEGENPR